MRDPAFANIEVVAQQMIEDASARAISHLNDGRQLKPYKVAEPVNGMVEFRLVEMADSACCLPGTVRLDGTRIAFTSPDIPTAYKSFRAAVGLA